MTFNENTPYSLYILQQHNNQSANGANLTTAGRQTSSLNTPVVALQSPMPALNYQTFSAAHDFSMNAINDPVATSSTNVAGIALTSWQNSNSTAGTISTSSTTGSGSSASAAAPSQQNLISGTLQHSG